MAGHCPVAPEGRGRLLLMLAAVLAVVVPFLFWNQTWFGRSLSNQEMTRYLGDRAHPRKIQHALSQMSARIASGDPTAAVWYPEVVALARSPLPEIRTTVAWVMGQDNRSESFHQSLLALLADPELVVRRNAALALVRFGDSSGRAEFLAMLQSYAIQAPVTGAARVQMKVGQYVGARALLARIQGGQGPVVEVRSPAAGRVSAIFIADGARVERGARIVKLEPESDDAWEALRALYLVGQPEDAPVVDGYAHAGSDIPDRVRRQAALTARAIRTRPERSPIR